MEIDKDVLSQYTDKKGSIESDYSWRAGKGGKFVDLQFLQ